MTTIRLALRRCLVVAFILATAPSYAQDCPVDDAGAEVFVKYTFGWVPALNGVGAAEHLLVLFPDGTAINRLPAAPVDTLSADAVRAAFEEPQRSWYVGAWACSEGRLDLTFKGKTRTLRPVPRGWWDDGNAPDPESVRDTYFPAVPLTPDDLAGPWETSSTYVSGLATYPAPAVAAGSRTKRVFYGDGTYADDEESYYRAAASSPLGGSYGTSGSSSSEAAGRWRLDGVTLTLESEGRTAVVPAFRLPHWSPDPDVDDIWIGDDVWERPEP